MNLIKLLLSLLFVIFSVKLTSSSDLVIKRKSPTSIEIQWDNFVKTYGKKYTTLDEKNRRLVTNKHT
jgi:hypothetical protein